MGDSNLQLKLDSRIQCLLPCSVQFYLRILDTIEMKYGVLRAPLRNEFSLCGSKTRSLSPLRYSTIASTGVRLIALDLRLATTKCGSISSTNSTKQKEYKGIVLHLELHGYVGYACESQRTRSELKRSRRITTTLSPDVSNSQTLFTQLCLDSGGSAT